MTDSNTSNASLCPGYKQVDAFGPDEEYEDDEEVAYVTLDLGNIEPTLVPSSSTYRLIGLDTPTPFLQLSGTILKGKHTSLLGTELLFTDSKDLNDKNKRSIAHVANTEQRICFQEVRLQPKGAEPAPSGKQKKKGNGQVLEDDSIDPALQLEEASQMVDRVTGKNPPHPRASRKRNTDQKGASKHKSAKKGKGKAAEETSPDRGGGSEQERDSNDGMVMDD